MNEQEQSTSFEILRRLNLSEEMVRAHVVLPHHIKDTVIRMETVDPARRPLLASAPPSGRFYRLDVKGLDRDLQALLNKCLVGCSMQLRRNGKVLLSQQWGHAKTLPDSKVSWTSSVPLHLASVSKMITAMAMTKLLGNMGVSPDTHIAPWLPDYWQKGHDVGRITFRHLLTHTSGLHFVDDPTPSDFNFMKDQIAIGTNNLGMFNYQNMNFGLCRILISALTGSVTPGATFQFLGNDFTDLFWDICSINAYRQYVTDNIFAPAGVSAATLDHPTADALAYTSPASGAGWNSNDLSTMSGGVGWHLSADDLIAVMDTFRRRGTIVGAARAQTMLDDTFGMDVVEDTDLGRMYAKGGYWSNGSNPDRSKNRTEQCNAYFLPQGMELVVLANSSLCSQGAFMDEVSKAIKNNVHSLFFSAILRVVDALKVVLRLLQRTPAPRP